MIITYGISQFLLSYIQSLRGSTVLYSGSLHATCFPIEGSPLPWLYISDGMLPLPSHIYLGILCCQILTLINTRPNNTPKEDDQNQLSEARVSDLQHIGTWIKSDPKVHEGNKTLITDERDACRPQEDRNADLPQTHDGQSDTQHMLERYMQQVRRTMETRTKQPPLSMIEGLLKSEWKIEMAGMT